MLKRQQYDMSHLSVQGSSGSLHFRYENVLLNGQQEKGLKLHNL